LAKVGFLVLSEIVHVELRWASSQFSWVSTAKAGGRGRRPLARQDQEPQTNGIAERFHRTVLDEFYRVTFRKTIYSSIADYGSIAELKVDLDRWVQSYNEERTFLDVPIVLHHWRLGGMRFSSLDALTASRRLHRHFDTVGSFGSTVADAGPFYEAVAPAFTGSFDRPGGRSYNIVRLGDPKLDW
jgi:hypothetical protein